MKYGIIDGDWFKLTDKGAGLPIIETEPPNIDIGYSASAHFEERNGQIVKVWEIQPCTEQDWQYTREAEAQTTAEESTPEVNPNA